MLDIHRICNQWNLLQNRFQEQLKFNERIDEEEKTVQKLLIAKIFTSNEIQKTSNQINFSTRGEKEKQYLKKSVVKNILSKHNFTANSEKTEEELIERSLEKKDETWSN